LRAIFRDNPDADPQEAAKQVKTHSTVAYKARLDVRAESGGQATNGRSDDLEALKRDIKAVKKIGIPRVRQILGIVEASTE
jgi:hypothetical protein